MTRTESSRPHDVRDGAGNKTDEMEESLKRGRTGSQ